MLDDNDLEAAVGASIVTQAQADALRDFAVRRRSSGTAEGERADEERFRFMRGFNDFFFAIGVVLFGVGLSIYAGLQANPWIYGFAALVMWGLAELLVGRRRLVLPGIVLVIFFAMFAVSAIPLADYFAATTNPLLPPSVSRFNALNLFFGSGGASQIAAKALIVSAAGALFYARFRFPFALLLVAGGAVAAFQIAATHFLFNDAVSARLLLVLACGVAVFGFAMWFDLSDRLRATRWSDCAFWLHVLAAPLMVHSLVGLVTGNSFQPNNYAAVMIVLVAVLMTAIALIIDRRALLVSALIYVGSVIAYTLSSATPDKTLILIATLVILGALVLALGIGWSPLRRRVVSMLSPAIAGRLPPVVPA